MEIERQFDRNEIDLWLEARTQRTVRVGIVFTLLLIPTGLGALLIAVLTWLHHRSMKVLMERGEMVPIELLQMKEGAAPESAVDAWEALDHGVPVDGSGSARSVQRIFLTIMPFIGLASAFLPVLPLRYTHSYGGRRREVGRYMYGDEQFHRDDAGGLWALVDPQHPVLNTWIVSYRG